jgi:GT2 family glycosyltransferase
LVSREFVGRVGLLDETFFLYYEEMDWCFRGRKLGFRVVYVPQARVYHKGGASTGGEGRPLVEYYQTRNLIYFMRKHAAPYHWIMFVPVFCLTVMKRLIRAFRRGNRAAIVSIARALWWQFRPESVYARMPPSGDETGVPPTRGRREAS